MPKRKLKMSPPEDVNQLRAQFDVLQDELMAKREQKRLSMQRYRAKLRTREYHSN